MTVGDAPMGASGIRLGAALFNGDHGRLAEEVARLENAGLDFLHLDVFEGQRRMGEIVIENCVRAQRGEPPLHTV